MNKEKNKKELKIYLIVFLLVLSICGFVGYGVYSYYWTQGTIKVEAGFHLIDSFRYIVNIDEEGTTPITQDNLNAGGEAPLKCPDVLNTAGANTCYAYANIKNTGHSAFSIKIDNFVKSVDASDNNDNIVWKTSDVRLSDNEFVLQSGEEKRVRIEVDVYTDGLSLDDPNNATYTGNEIEGETVKLNLEYDITATQYIE